MSISTKFPNVAASAASRRVSERQRSGAKSIPSWVGLIVMLPSILLSDSCRRIR